MGIKLTPAEMSNNVQTSGITTELDGLSFICN